jgi:cytoskeletal protein CcmA (bactofilin family)
MADGNGDVTVLGRDARLEGDFVISGSIRIDGVFKGRIAAEGGVTLSSGCDVEADVKGTNVTVAGQLRGNVVARNRAEIASTAHVDGDVTSSALVVGQGAVFNGRSIMGGDGGGRSTG